MIYDNKDNHIVVNKLKEKGWVLFDVSQSRVKNIYGGWWIDTAPAYGTEHYDSHKKIDGIFLGSTLKESLHTIKGVNFPTNKKNNE